jgi:pteridine reductase
MASENRNADSSPGARPDGRPEARLDGQLALVTGAARRLGRAIARELSSAGAQVAIHCRRSVAEAEELAAALPGSFVLQADLRDADQTAALLRAAQARSQSGRVDLLVNNAACFQRTPFAALDDGVWAEVLDLNLTAPQRCLRLALPLGLRAAVNVIDVAAWQPWSEYAAYGVSKAGLLHLTRVLARELAPAVRVNAVAPGSVIFPEDYDEAARARALLRVPLGRAGSPEDVARAVRFLLAEPYLTGVCLPVDGGQGLR